MPPHSKKLSLPTASENRRSSFPALRHRDFRLLWLGQIVSVTGSQMQLVAINWHVYLLTKSAFAVGAQLSVVVGGLGCLVAVGIALFAAKTLLNYREGPDNLQAGGQRSDGFKNLLHARVYNARIRAIARRDIRALRPNSAFA